MKIINTLPRNSLKFEDKEFCRDDFNENPTCNPFFETWDKEGLEKENPNPFFEGDEKEEKNYPITFFKQKEKVQDYNKNSEYVFDMHINFEDCSSDYCYENDSDNNLDSSFDISKKKIRKSARRK